MGNDLSESNKVFNERYQLTQKLGDGGMADVYLAQDLVLQRLVAVKVLFQRFAADACFVERFRREAQAAANFNHPNIVAVHDYGESDGTYFIVMENVEGTTLSQVIQEATTLDAATTKRLVLSIAQGLGFAHERGTIHRDIKPANILLTKANQPKVSDFGIARAMDKDLTGLTQTGSVVGTATYFSPEQAQGKTVDARSDLYSLGIVMFQMLNGYPPFDADSSVALALKHVQEPIPAVNATNKALSPSMVAVVERLLEKNPDDRFQTAEELVKALRQVDTEDSANAAPSKQPATKGFVPPGTQTHTQAHTTPAPPATLPTQVAPITPPPSNTPAQQWTNPAAAQPNHQQAQNNPYQPQPVTNNFASAQTTYQQGPPSSGSSQKWVYIGIAAFLFIALGSIGAFLLASNNDADPETKNATSDNDSDDITTTRPDDDDDTTTSEPQKSDDSDDVFIALMTNQFQQPDLMGEGVTLSEREASCLAKGMVNDIGLDNMAEFSDPNYTASEKEAQVFVDCLDLKNVMQKNLTEEQDLTEAQAKCIIDAVEDDDLEEAFIAGMTGGDLSSDLNDKFFEAGFSCGNVS